MNAYLWENGSIVDLNTLILGGSNLHLFAAGDINDSGEIAGLGSLPNGNFHAFLLIPIGETALNVRQVTAAPRRLTSAEITAIRGLLGHRYLGFRRLLRY